MLKSNIVGRNRPPRIRAGPTLLRPPLAWAQHANVGRIVRKVWSQTHAHIALFLVACRQNDFGRPSECCASVNPMRSHARKYMHTLCVHTAPARTCTCVVNRTSCNVQCAVCAPSTPSAFAAASVFMNSVRSRRVITRGDTVSPVIGRAAMRRENASAPTKQLEVPAVIENQAPSPCPIAMTSVRTIAVHIQSCYIPGPCTFVRTQINGMSDRAEPASSAGNAGNWPCGRISYDAPAVRVRSTHSRFGRS